jgi:hypothetical protein
MDETAARAEAKRLNHEHPERETYEWVALARAAGQWAVIKTARRKRVDPLTATTEAAPKPPHPEDPRRGGLRDLPGYG